MRLAEAYADAVRVIRAGGQRGTAKASRESQCGNEDKHASGHFEVSSGVQVTGWVGMLLAGSNMAQSTSDVSATTS